MLPAVLLLPIYGSLGGLFGSTSARSGVSIELQTSGADPELRRFARECAKATLPPHLLRVRRARLSVQTSSLLACWRADAPIVVDIDARRPRHTMMMIPVETTPGRAVMSR